MAASLACAAAAQDDAGDARGTLADHPAVLAGQFTGLSATGGAFTDDGGNLVRARFNQVNDAMGFRWDVDQQGGINDGTNDCFDGGMYLRVNGNQFGPNDHKMVPDASEYFISGQIANLQVTRRVRVDVQRGGARFIEVLTNPHASNAVSASVDIVTNLGGQAGGAFTSSGKPFAGGTLGKDDVGFFMAAQAANSRPSVMFLVGDGRGSVKPQITIENNRQITVRYAVTIKPRETVALYHVVAQRQGGGGGASATQAFETFYKRRHLQPSVPKSLAKALLNVRIAGGAVDGERLTQRALTIAEDAGVERGDRDVLVVGDDAQIVGDVTCEGLSIQSAFGATHVAWDEVALLVGARGIGAPMSVHLRSGDVLHGPVTTPRMVMSSGIGPDMALDPTQINLLVARRRDTDDKPYRQAGAVVTTASGDRLAVRRDDSAPLKLVTPWGTLAVTMADIVSLDFVREPQPGHVLTLAGGTRLTVMLGGGALKPHTLRFGPIELPPYSVESLARLHELPAAEEAQESAAAELERQRQAFERSPRLQLVGDNAIVGTLGTASINIVGLLGVATLDTATIKSIARQEGKGAPTFTITLRSGGAVTGRIEQRMLPVQTAYRDWLVPTEHIVEVIVPDPLPAEAAAAEVANAATATGDPAAASPAAPPLDRDLRLRELVEQQRQLLIQQANAMRNNDEPAAKAAREHLQTIQREIQSLRRPTTEAP